MKVQKYESAFHVLFTCIQKCYSCHDGEKTRPIIKERKKRLDFNEFYFSSKALVKILIVSLNGCDNAFLAISLFSIQFRHKMKGRKEATDALQFHRCLCSCGSIGDTNYSKCYHVILLSEQRARAVVTTEVTFEIPMEKKKNHLTRLVLLSHHVPKRDF